MERQNSHNRMQMGIDGEAIDWKNSKQLWIVIKIDYEGEQANPGSQNAMVRARICYTWNYKRNLNRIHSSIKVREYHFKVWNPNESYRILQFPYSRGAYKASRC